MGLLLIIVIVGGLVWGLIALKKKEYRKAKICFITSFLINCPIMYILGAEFIDGVNRRKQGAENMMLFVLLDFAVLVWSLFYSSESSLWNLVHKIIALGLVFAL